ncbi:MAG: antibiotic biosynthesis monooxygenase [Chloroflexi bacterium]|jgi:heme-degrading monooxygenase HmoA|nr:antibiotic biosynthesis monooxygenase family protein [Anaerolineaceae bacterium]NMB88340.1 antibiotic biosynthesis monooxygenase [Chloroflexota bacterium]
MIERHVIFHVYPDRMADFERLFREHYRPAMSAMPGFVKAELLRDQATAHVYQMVIRFESSEDAAAWRSSGAHQALKPTLTALYTDNEVSVYEVIA